MPSAKLPKVQWVRWVNHNRVITYMLWGWECVPTDKLQELCTHDSYGLLMHYPGWTFSEAKPPEPPHE